MNRGERVMSELSSGMISNLSVKKTPQLDEEEINEIKKKIKKDKVRSIWRNRYLYYMILPGFLYFLVFQYGPMFGLVMAFQNYQPYAGIAGSEWVGFQHFQRLFTEPTFFRLLRNTLVLFVYDVLTFPLPIILSLMLNEVRHKVFKKSIQTIIYIPYFLSWVIVVSIFFTILNVDSGLVNGIITRFGGEPIPFLTDPRWARPVYVFQGVWRGLGWSTIIYLAAITGVDLSLYEAARMDGAGRLRLMWHITLPAIKPVIVTLLILKVGNTLDIGFEHIFLLMNPLNREVLDVFDTYVYTAGIQNGQLSFSTAVGMFKSVVGLVLVILANRAAKKFGEDGIY